MVWVKAVYQATRTFPDTERYGITSQLCRAAVSVPSNIAEGAGRNSDAEFVRFIEISYGSLMEATCQLHLSADLGYISRDEVSALLTSADEIARMLSGLRQHRLGSSPH